LVHGCDDSGPSTSTLDLVVRLEGVIGKKGIEHGTIEAVASRTHEAYDSTDVEHNCMPGEERNRFLEPCFCERFGAGDDLDFSNSALEVLQFCQFEYSSSMA
jgi:hypothetical protein